MGYLTFNILLVITNNVNPTEKKQWRLTHPPQIKMNNEKSGKYQR